MRLDLLLVAEHRLVGQHAQPRFELAVLGVQAAVLVVLHEDGVGLGHGEASLFRVRLA